MTKDWKIYLIITVATVFSSMTSAQSVDSLRPQSDDYKKVILTFHLDSLFSRVDKIKFVSRLSLVATDNSKIEATLFHGAPIGLCHTFYSSGQMNEEAMFDSIVELQTRFDGCCDGVHGDPIKIEYYQAKVIYYKKWYTNGLLQEAVKYKNGIEHSRQEFYRNGNSKLLSVVSHDTTSTTSWYDNGKKRSELVFLKKTGLYNSKYYYPNGQLENEKVHTDRKKDNYYVCQYQEDGQLIKKIYFVNGVQIK